MQDAARGNLGLSATLFALKTHPNTSVR